MMKRFPTISKVAPALQGIDIRKLIASWKWIFFLFIVMRLTLSIIGVVVLWNGQPVTPVETDEPTIYRFVDVVAPPGSHWWDLLVNSWYRWDTGWYLKIAALGYSANDGSVVFPPLYPLLIRWLHPIFGGSYILAALVIANLFCLSSLILLYEVGLHEFGAQRTARWAVIFLLVFPTGFYLFMAYSESFFLTLVMTAWLLARRRQWFWAGIVAGLGALTRLQGWWLALPLLWLYLVDALALGLVDTPSRQISALLAELRKPERRKLLLASIGSFRWLWLCLPVLAYLAYDIWLRSASLGDILQAYSRYWYSSLAYPWRALAANLHVYRSGASANDWMNLIFFVLLVTLLVYILLRFKVEFSLYSWGLIVLALGRIYIYPFYAIPRYMLTVFPLFFALAIIARRRWINPLLFGLFAGLQIILVWLYLNWFWVA